MRQADQARTYFAAIESELEVIQKQLARLSTRRGYREPRARHHLRDDETDDAEPAILSAANGI
jgi:hypothetical protein